MHFISCSVELSHVAGFFFYYFWRVEVKVTCYTLEVFHKPGFLSVFTISGFLAWLFCFLSSMALNLTSFLDFISIFSAVAWNCPTCQHIYYFWRVEFKVTCCSLEVFLEPGLFCVFTLRLSWLAFLFLSPIVLKFLSPISALAWNYPTWQVFFCFSLFQEG